VQDFTIFHQTKKISLLLMFELYCMKAMKALFIASLALFLSECNNKTTSENMITQKNSLGGTEYKPLGYTSVAPYFSVHGATAFVDFVKHVFNAEILGKYEHDDGSIYHMEMKIDDSIIMITEASNDFPANQSAVHVFVKDAKSVYDRALSKGATGISRPSVAEGDTDLRGMFKDAFGNTWAIATHQFVGK
jgi:PhnB protein